MRVPRLTIASLGAAGAALVMALFITQCRAEGAKRVIAVGGAITEVVYALNQQHRLVAVDTTSLHPPQALKEKPNVGYMRALSAEGILSLRPDLVMALEAAGPPDTLRLLREADVKLDILPEDLSEAGVLKRIRAIGKALDATGEAEELAKASEAGFAALARERSSLGKAPRVLFILSLANGRVMVAGRNSSADAMIRLAGGANAAGSIEGYKPLSDEGIIAAAPDIILAMSRPGAPVDEAAFLSHTALALTPAGKVRALLTFDGQFLLGFGPRAPEAGLALLAGFKRLGGTKP